MRLRRALDGRQAFIQSAGVKPQTASAVTSGGCVRRVLPYCACARSWLARQLQAGCGPAHLLASARSGCEAGSGLFLLASPLLAPPGSARFPSSSCNKQAWLAPRARVPFSSPCPVAAARVPTLLSLLNQSAVAAAMNVTPTSSLPLGISPRPPPCIANEKAWMEQTPGVSAPIHAVRRERAQRRRVAAEIANVNRSPEREPQ
ncbi:hypothetical protein NDU88_004522 [Pleurodeles waltl]|uniref:Uncharacterized protein n=1 Tax=Pleurodeles waltl TaxID=8319 RepID=A0AAV7WYI9_PLEWA|nr:hypothetical protein NDU88_004522 [Pleurodeles waltl]